LKDELLFFGAGVDRYNYRAKGRGCKHAHVTLQNLSPCFKLSFSRARAIDGIDIYFEQPCATYEECRDLRRTTAIPVILDECVTVMDVLVRARNDGVLDGVNIKFQRHGGLWRSRAVRDSCAALNVPMHVQDSGASEIGNAAIVHFAHPVPERALLYVWDATNLIETPTAHGAPCIEASRMQASEAPGLGVEPLADVIGQAVAVYK
jgi:L-alanine-DL-glutamate epimerase-like enolase superfamily enzyme